MKQALTAGCMIVLLTASHSHAQYSFEGTATFVWEASTNNGSSWQRDLVLLNPQQSFLVRALVSFDAGQGRYFGTSWFDPYATSAGPGDAADNFSFRFPFHPTDGIASFHQGSVMRIERGNDGAPPGQGVGWIKTDQSHVTGAVTFANPVDIFTFRYLPDATPGDRVLTSAFFLTPGWDSNRVVRVNVFPDGQQIVPATTLLPLTIRVIPAPAPLALLGVSLALTPRRRR